MNSTTVPVPLPDRLSPATQPRTTPALAIAKSEKLGNLLREIRHDKQQAIEREAAERLKAFMAAVADRD